MKIYVTDKGGKLQPIEGESVVLELDNGKTIELAEFIRQTDRPAAISIWGGRQPRETWTEADRHLSEQLNLSLIAGNCVDVWPGQAKKQE